MEDTGECEDDAGAGAVSFERVLFEVPQIVEHMSFASRRAVAATCWSFFLAMLQRQICDGWRPVLNVFDARDVLPHAIADRVAAGTASTGTAAYRGLHVALTDTRALLGAIERCRKGKGARSDAVVAVNDVVRAAQQPGAAPIRVERVTSMGDQIALSRNSRPADALADLLAQPAVCGTLWDLQLATFPLRDAGATALASAMPRCVGLTCVSLTSCQVGGEGARALAQVLGKLSLLRTLELSDNPLGDAGVSAVAEALGPSRALRVLELARVGSGAVGARALRKLLGRQSALEELWLGGNVLRDVGARELGEELVNGNARLRVLDLPDNSIGPEGAWELAQGLEFCRALEEVCLDDNRIRDDGAAAVADALATSPTLARLALRHCGVGDRTATAAARLLQGCPRLADVNLARNKIGDAGAKTLASSLERSRITDLDLCENRIGVRGGFSLGRAVERMSRRAEVRLF
ncbi:unnamed protein product [Pedinophyceae sp. YPF-701]|nr:unnamed protein product [Pedinophyceae sp. YPF-701]